MTLAWWGQSRRWWMLRGLSLATTAVWTRAIIAAHHDGMMPLGFAILYAILYHAEVIASALRADREAEKTRSLRHGSTLFVTLVVAGLTAAILSALNDSTPMTRTTWLAAEALACGTWRATHSAIRPATHHDLSRRRTARALPRW